MLVKIYQATIVIQKKERRLTKAVAKQFPFQHWEIRWNKAIRGKVARGPLCKVAGKTLRQAHTWLYLVEDKEAGLAWVPAVIPPDHMRQAFRERGGWVDDPAQVPTVIL